MEGNILKMTTSLEDVVQYSLPIGDQKVHLNDYLGKTIKLEFKGQINCIATGEQIKKSYNQGYSYKSFISLARCDMCIVKPELCHFDKGTCREPDWGEKHCMIPHYVYLSNTSGVKVGITRHTQIPTRWIDQGATQALPILKVKNRLTSGLIEHEIKSILADKTDWRKMLRGEGEPAQLYDLQEQIYDQFADILDDHDAEDLEEEVLEINYPILEYPTKVKSLSFDKTPEVEGTLLGIKGQYLILDTGVLNMRKHQGYYLYLS